MAHLGGLLGHLGAILSHLGSLGLDTGWQYLLYRCRDSSRGLSRAILGPFRVPKWPVIALRWPQDGQSGLNMGPRCPPDGLNFDQFGCLPDFNNPLPSCFFCGGKCSFIFFCWKLLRMAKSVFFLRFCSCFGVLLGLFCGQTLSPSVSGYQPLLSGLQLAAVMVP